MHEKSACKHTYREADCNVTLTPRALCNAATSPFSIALRRCRALSASELSAAECPRQRRDRPRTNQRPPIAPRPQARSATPRRADTLRASVKESWVRSSWPWLAPAFRSRGLDCATARASGCASLREPLDRVPPPPTRDALPASSREVLRLVCSCCELGILWPLFYRRCADARRAVAAPQRSTMHR